MTAQFLETYNGSGTGAAPAKRRTDASEEYALLAAAKRGDSAAFEFLCKHSAKMVFRFWRQRSLAGQTDRGAFGSSARRSKVIRAERDSVTCQRYLCSAGP